MTSILRAFVLLFCLALTAHAMAASVTVVSGGGQTARSGTFYAQPLVFQVRDDSGAPLPGVTVQLARGSFGDPRWAFGPFTQNPVTDAQGVVSFGSLVAQGPAGSFSIGVNVVFRPSSGELFPDVFEMHISGAQPARVELLSGAGQSAPVNQLFASPLVARVIDELGAPVPNAVVRFDLRHNSDFIPPPGTPVATFVSGDVSTVGLIALVAADDRGIAVSPGFRANEGAGAWTMMAAAFFAPWGIGGPVASTPMRNLAAGSTRGVLAATAAAIDSDGSAPFNVGVRLLTPEGLPQASQTIRFELGDGALQATVSPAAVLTDSQGYAFTRVYPQGMSAGFTIRALWQDQLATIKVTRVEAEATAGVEDMWWAGPDENGWGLSIVQSGDQLFTGFYGYDASGSPIWHVMSSGSWNSARTVFSGLLFAPKGSPFFAYDASRLQVGAPVGVATFTFTGRDTAELELTVDGVITRKSITRQVFGAGARTGPAVGGMWWGGLAQNGWGLSIMQQGSELFSVWYTYDASGNGVWYVLPGGDWTSPTTYEGRVYQTSGSPLAAYDPARLRVTDVGSYRMRFEGSGATLEYSVEGRTGTLSLTRQLF